MSDFDEVLEEAMRDSMFDGVVVAYCDNCDYPHRVEPDCDGFTCHSCDEGQVVSPLVLAGMI